MPKCIFCPAELDGATKPEHILLNALGGRKTTTQVVCSGCNNAFGGTIDDALARQGSVIRNLLQMPSGTGGPAPTLKRVKAGDEEVDLRGDGRIDLVARPFVIEPLEGGGANVLLTARSEEEFEAIIPHLAAALRMEEGKVRRQLAASRATIVTRRPKGIVFNLSFGGEEAFRAAAKACLVLWATLVGNDEVRREEFEAARNFVNVGNEEFHAERASLDSRLLPNAPAIAAAYGPLFNLIYVASDASGRVIGHFTLYNLISFQIVLADAGGTPLRKVALVSNPLAPSRWSVRAEEDFDVDFSWLETPERAGLVEQTKERFTALMEQYVQQERPKAISKICDDVFGKYGLAGDDPIPDDVLDGTTEELVHRVAAHILGLPFEQELTREQMEELFLARGLGSADET